MKFILSLCAFAALASTTPAHAATNLDLFHKLVDVQRDGQRRITQVVIKPTTALQSADTTVDIASELLSALDRMEAPASLTSTDEQMLSNAGWTQDDIKNYNDAREVLSSRVDIQNVLSDKNITKLLNRFQREVNAIYQFNVLAKPGSPGYFHDRRLINMAINRALSEAEGLLGNVPVLRVVSFLLHKTLGWIEDKRSYSQNVLLYFIEQNSPTALGFTAQEAAHIKSSIYERQIAWWDLAKVEDAKKKWNTYGTELFSNQVRGNADRLVKYGKKYSVGAKYCYAFTAATKGGVSYILNTQDKKSKISKDLSVAYDGGSPARVRTQREQLLLTQFAANFLPLPGFAISQLQSLIGSYFAPQRLTEGALFAHLSSTGRAAEAQVVLQQSVNPILIHELKQR